MVFAQAQETIVYRTYVGGPGLTSVQAATGNYMWSTQPCLGGNNCEDEIIGAYYACQSHRVKPIESDSESTLGGVLDRDSESPTSL